MRVRILKKKRKRKLKKKTSGVVKQGNNKDFTKETNDLFYVISDGISFSVLTCDVLVSRLSNDKERYLFREEKLDITRHTD